jgi:large subunit ribosomal protein L29
MVKKLELQNKNIEELKNILIDLRKESLNMRFQKASGQFENTANIRYVKRNIARIKTFLVLKNISKVNHK